MYENQADYPREELVAKQTYAAGQVVGAQRRLEVTLRQNIDQQIAQAEAHVKTLQETKARMEASGVLDLRIDDLNRAMRF
jgi:phage-related protein